MSTTTTTTTPMVWTCSKNDRIPHNARFEETKNKERLRTTVVSFFLYLFFSKNNIKGNIASIELTMGLTMDRLQ